MGKSESSVNIAAQAAQAEQQAKRERGPSQKASCAEAFVSAPSVLPEKKHITTGQLDLPAGLESLLVGYCVHVACIRVL